MLAPPSGEPSHGTLWDSGHGVIQIHGLRAPKRNASTLRSVFLQLQRLERDVCSHEMLSQAQSRKLQHLCKMMFRIQEILILRRFAYYSVGAGSPELLNTKTPVALMAMHAAGAMAKRRDPTSGAARISLGCSCPQSRVEGGEGAKKHDKHTSISHSPAPLARIS